MVAPFHRLLGAAAIAVLAFLPRDAIAQGTGTGIVVVRVVSEGRPVAGATVASRSTRALTDPSGEAALTLPLGPRMVMVTRIGFAPESLAVTVREEPIAVTVTLHAAAVELPEIVVATTRNERRVTDEPTRVEVTDREDVEEQIGGSPGVIAELLTESGGVRVQRTSAGTGGASVRIRGMRGRYTKILSDGLPLFGVSTEGLGPLQIPPIDLHRVEVIKGVASALYGPSALGGVVNLVSERPDARSEVVLNQTSRGGSDAVLWQAHPLSPRWGYTLVAGAHRQSKEDNDADGWADLTGFQRAVVRPRLFWTGSGGNSWFLTGGLTAESRTGGTVNGDTLPDGLTHREDADTWRADAGSVARLILSSGALLSLRGSVTEEWRTQWFGAVRERDRRSALFSEAALTVTRGSQVLVAGAAVERDAYTALDVPLHDYTYTAPALFAEHTWSPVPWFGLSSSARLDFHSRYGRLFSPRVSALVRAGRDWSARLSAGGAVFAPTPFTEETEAIGLSNLRAINGLRVERATGASLDVGGVLGPVELNASAHHSIVRRPVAFRPVAGSPTDVELVNAGGPTRTSGLEVYARWRFEPFHVTASYTYLRATELDAGTGTRREVPLNPRHAGGLSVVYEEEDDTQVGLEFYYNGRQSLAGDPYRAVSAPYTTIDALIQHRLGRFIVFLHGEDLNNVRQTTYDPIVRPSPGAGGRWTTDVWAPLEGRVINAGFRLRT